MVTVFSNCLTLLLIGNSPGLQTAKRVGGGSPAPLFCSSLILNSRRCSQSTLNMTHPLPNPKLDQALPCKIAKSLGTSLRKNECHAAWKAHCNSPTYIWLAKALWKYCILYIKDKLHLDHQKLNRYHHTIIVQITYTLPSHTTKAAMHGDSHSAVANIYNFNKSMEW